MKIHLKHIPTEGLHVEGEETPDVLDFSDELVSPMGPIHYSLEVGLSDGGLFATGSVGADFEMECVRCLEKFVYPVELTDFAMQMELTGAESSVDLTEDIREDILLALPAHPHCDWDGAKPCTGVRMTTITTETQAEPEGKNPWTELDKLTKPE